jgi:hypothetical protein
MSPASTARILLALASAVAAPAAVAAGMDDEGREIYEGRHAVLAATTVRGDTLAPVPAQQAACVACHRPSGLGSFEGEAAVPPIGSGLLATPFDPATTRRYDAPGRARALRVRPAYDAAALHRLLTEGRTPDGRDIGAIMPRYRLQPAHSSALLSYLNRLGTEPTPGVEAEVVHFATITSDELPQWQVQELTGVLHRFFERKNALTRGEERRRASALRNEHTMYSRFRRWALHHWVLRGGPETWRAQLEAAYRAQPVFAVLSGRSSRDWTPVHEFCERERLPCLFPITAWPPAQTGFYAAYFSGGAAAQARWLAGRLRSAHAAGTRASRWLVLAGQAPGEAELGQRLAGSLREGASGGDDAGAGPREVVVATSWRGEPVVVSALPPAQVRRALAEAAAEGAGAALPGGRDVSIYLLAAEAPPRQAQRPGEPAAPPWPASAVVHWVTQQHVGAPALARARAGWRAQGFAPRDEAQAAQVLLAATAAVESLVHVDERFSREFCLEKLEHNLENLPPLTGYPRLALAPGQRFAAKAVWLASP